MGARADERVAIQSMTASIDMMLDDDDDILKDLPSFGSSKNPFAALAAQQAQAVKLFQKSEERAATVLTKIPAASLSQSQDDEDGMVEAPIPEDIEAAVFEDDDAEPCFHESGVISPVEKGVRSKLKNVHSITTPIQSVWRDYTS